MTDSPRSLADSLRAASANDIAILLRARPDLWTPKPTSIAELADRAASVSSSRMALERLNAWQRRVAVALAAVPEDTSTRRLAALLQADHDSVADAVTQLLALGLAWGTPRLARVTAGVRQVVGPFPAGLAPASPMPLSDTDIDAALAEGGTAVRELLQRLVWELPVGQVRDADRRGSGDTPADKAISLKLLRPREAHSVILPREVSLRLRGGRLFETPLSVTVPPWPSIPDSPAQDTVDRAGLGSGFELVRHAERMLDWIAAHPPRPLTSGGIAKRDTAAIAQLLGDAELASWLLPVSQRAGLIATSGPEWLPTQRFDDWAASSDWQRWQQLLLAWTRLSSWPGTGAVLAPGSSHAWAAELRSMTASQLSSAPTGTPISAQALADRLAWLRPQFDHEELADQAQQVLREATWLGVVALGKRTHLIDTSDDPGFPEPVDQFVIQSDLTAVAPGPLRRDVYGVLSLIASTESTGGAGVHRFTPASIRAAMDAGWSPSALREWIGQHSLTGISQPLDYLIDDVARTHGAVRVAAVSSVLTIEDPALAQALLSDPRAEDLGLRRLSDTVVAATAEPDEVVSVLRRLGHAPIAMDANGQVATTPAARRARVEHNTPGPSQAPDRTETLRLAEQLLARVDPSVFAKASDDIVDVLRRYQGSQTWLDLDFVDDEGTPRTQSVRVMGMAAGKVRLQPKAAQAVTLSLSRVVGVRVPRRLEQG